MKPIIDDKRFLIFTALGLVPVALSYGWQPDASLPYLFNIHAEDVNSRHIFRAMTGLYMAMIGLWLLGALRQKYREIALYSLIVFMLGLAFGRMVSFVLDGTPHWLLMAYAFFELVLGCVGIYLVKHRDIP